MAAVEFAQRAESKDGVRHSLLESQQALDLARAGRNLGDNMALRQVSASPAFVRAILRAGQMRSTAVSRQRALRTLQRFARYAREAGRGEFVVVTGNRGRRLATLPSGMGPATFLFPGAASSPGPGVWDVGGTLYSVTTLPVEMRGRLIGSLSVGSRFDFAGLDRLGPVALLHHGRVVRSTFSPAAASQIQDLPSDCIRGGCELRVNGEDFLAIPVSPAAAGAGFGAEDQLVSFRSIDAAVNQIWRGFRRRLRVLAIAITLLAVCLSILVSHAVSRPLRQLAARLERSQAAGRWEADFLEDSSAREVNQLAAAINRAAMAVVHSNERLDQASVDFVESMAQALDARDPYTAGHSQRVSNYAMAIATAMRLSPGEIETIRVGARLHDIGKIGVSDTVLRKAGRLTPEEYEVIKLHPQIGRKILERVAAFERYLPFVELHHEDLDGGGYPYGLKGDEVPLAIRIVRVADVFDALTTDRAYRGAMPPDRAYEMIEARAGSKFDPEVVRALRAALGDSIPNLLGLLESSARATLS